ncbi:MAG: hypothetical protein IV108_03010 [Burkholderiales bacterium]|nr:hypothetical protein [Burkholderiales bacterium]
MVTILKFRISSSTPFHLLLRAGAFFNGRSAAFLGFLFALSLAPLAHAIGPTLPLAFDDQIDPKEPWLAQLRVDHEQIKDVKIERQIFRRGEPLRAERLELPRDVAAQVPLTLRFKGIEDLTPGAYAQKITAEGQWALPGKNKPLHVEQWFYFVVKKGEVARIDAEEYGKINDPSEYGAGPDGQKVPVSSGGGVKGKVPLQRTKSMPAVPLGRLGEILEESPPGVASKARQADKDKSEINEK